MAWKTTMDTASVTRIRVYILLADELQSMLSPSKYFVQTSFYIRSDAIVVYLYYEAYTTDHGDSWKLDSIINNTNSKITLTCIIVFNKSRKSKR